MIPVIGFMRDIYSQHRKYLDGTVVNEIATDVVPVWRYDHPADGICWIADEVEICFEI